MTVELASAVPVIVGAVIFVKVDDVNEGASGAVVSIINLGIIKLLLGLPAASVTVIVLFS